ncbi:LDH2 family malate/lactate/ureidoglycolate dehydrogenase [Hephaestia caeni]|uniref:LDH2 family malate/lactate/ureidoglycolate dehydrogenase n=1 Tax=Hephaestia caeni TaxID=645617 RepID=A0A397NNA3_9SPHN|nr:Ldh family oxidoreductase [Hephaestia caeni]RIA37089.1 LDH2 family malate/lactate/ureidoglycolate dehydrogenase [Hephaestia caeni]
MGDTAAPDQARTAIVSVSALQKVVAALFVDAGMRETASQTIATALVEADRQGIGSHGVAMAQMYIERLERGSVSRAESVTIVQDNDAVAVLDAGHMLGHLAGDEAMAIAVDKAHRFGLGVVAVCHGFHFGVAGRYAASATRAGCIGIAMCNTRPMIAPPGGLAPTVGNNPLAIAVPTSSGTPILLDMAMSEVALARIRAAARNEQAIPPDWAVGADGRPTTDPHVALEGMLAPMGGTKGFALALLIDAMCGLLAGGAWGADVKPLFDDLSQPADCSFLFIALNIAHFRPIEGFLEEATMMRERVRAVPNRNEGQTPVPGDRRAALAREQAAHVALDQAVLDRLTHFAVERGVDASSLTSLAAVPL